MIRCAAKTSSEIFSHGAVRHAAECFNYYFPQDLDDEFLVVWHSYSSSHRRYLSEPELRQFLIERVADGYVFPVSPHCGQTQTHCGQTQTHCGQTQTLACTCHQRAVPRLAPATGPETHVR
jgi:hypothetical protein